MKAKIESSLPLSWTRRIIARCRSRRREAGQCSRQCHCSHTHIHTHADRGRCCGNKVKSQLGSECHSHIMYYPISASVCSQGHVCIPGGMYERSNICRYLLGTRSDKRYPWPRLPTAGVTRLGLPSCYSSVSDVRSILSNEPQA